MQRHQGKGNNQGNETFGKRQLELGKIAVAVHVFLLVLLQHGVV